jgi:hypothetical protein
MKRILMGILFLLFCTLIVELPALADGSQPQLTAQQTITSVPLRGIGIAVSFPLPSLPAPATTATIFLDTFFQGSISSSLVSRTDVRFFFHFLSGFRLNLTSIRESIMVVFSPAPVVFSIGGGLGVFPIQGTPVGTSDGLLLSFHARANLEIQVASLGLFLDATYETLPQPFADIHAAGTLIASALEFSVGAVFHF